MSSASIPAPRVAPPSISRHSLFLPFLILLLGIGSQAVYEILAMEDHLDEVTTAVDKMNYQVKDAPHQRAKYYALARDVLNLAPNDPVAEGIVDKFRIREAQAAQPALFNATPGNPDSGAATNTAAPVPPPASTTPAH